MSVLGSVAVTSIGMLLFGLGSATSNVAANVEGAALENALGRSIMPLMHGFFSIGTVLGAVVGSIASAAQMPVAWRDPRTLLVGVFVLGMALTEGATNDWVALAITDGYSAPAYLGAVGYGIFVAAMTTGRLSGTWLIDRFGRLAVLRTACLLALLGLGAFLGGPPLLGLLGERVGVRSALGFVMIFVVVSLLLVSRLRPLDTSVTGSAQGSSGTAR